MASKSDMLDEYKGDVDFDFFETPRDVTELKKVSNVGENRDSHKTSRNQNGRRKRSSDSESDTDSRSESDREINSVRSTSNRSDVSSVLTIEARVPTAEMRASLEAGSDDSDLDSPKNHKLVNDKSAVKSKTKCVSSLKSKNSNAWSKSSESRSPGKTASVDKTRNKNTAKSNSNGVKARNSRKYSDSDDSYSDSTESSRSRSGSRSSESCSSSVTDSRSETGSDVTEVSPLASPDLSPAGSPRRKVKSSPRHIRRNTHEIKTGNSPHKIYNRSASQNSGRGDELLDNNKAYPQGLDRSDDLDTESYDDPDLDKDRMNLRLLMQAVLEMDKDLKERQDRLKASRRVMGPTGPQVKPQPHSRKNFSFANDKTKEIDRENQRLLQKIMSDSTVAEKKKKKKSIATQPPSMKRVTNATINRQRQQRVIEQENLAMLKRLESIRPTKGMSRNEHLNNFNQQQSYGVPLHGASPGRKSRPTSAYGAALSTKSASMTSLRSTTSLTSVTSQKHSTRSRAGGKPARDRNPPFEPGTGRWSFKPERDFSDDDL